MVPRPESRRSVVTSALLCALACFSGSARADAGPAQSFAVPSRYVVTASGGAPLRLTKDDAFDQSTLAPAFADALGGYILGSNAGVRHGVGLGLSLNLSKDGGFTEPVESASQLVLMPAYLLFCDFGADIFALGHAGLPVLVTQNQTAGLEVAFALGYRLFAGAGGFAEVGLDAFIGSSGSVHATASLELGVFVDYEVLP